MKTISSNTTAIYEINNSKFITLLYKINDSTDINSILNQVKDMYPKATHYCYCYRNIDKMKSSDDGEPTGTAGIPMLNVLIKEDIVNVLAITVRYFGGIKLGAGGLVRAYTKSLTMALEKTNYKNLVDGYILKIYISYENVKQLDYILKDITIINKEFLDKVIYTIKISKDDLELVSKYNYEIIDEELIEL